MKLNFIQSLNFNPFKSKTQTSMKNAKLSAILGRDVNDGYVPTAEEMLIILNAVPNQTETTPENAPEAKPETTTETPSPEASTPAVDIQAAISAAVSASIAPLTQSITELSARLTVVEGKPGAEATNTPPVDGGEKKVHSWEDPNSPINKHSASFFEQK